LREFIIDLKALDMVESWTMAGSLVDLRCPGDFVNSQAHLLSFAF
jgi:hypothetical protein